MREIWYIRHAESEWNAQGRWQGHSDPPLSALGEEQARRLGERLRDQGFDAIFGSDLGRARRTAELAFAGRPVAWDARLREINFGEFEGHTLDDCGPALQEQFHDWWRDPFGTRTPGGESLTDLSVRVNRWLGELPEAGRVAVVTHGGVIRTVLWGITGPPHRGAWTVTLDNTSITRIRSRPGRITIDCLNDTAHLAGV